MIIDTAGLEESFDESIQGRMRRQTEQAIDHCDLAVFIIDGRAGITSMDLHFAQFIRKRHIPVLLAVNKCEGNKGMDSLGECYSLGLGDPIAISAEHNEGVTILYDAILESVKEHFIEELDDEEYHGSDDDIEIEEGDINFEANIQEIDPTKPIKVAIVGRPNAGKSTFLAATTRAKPKIADYPFTTLKPQLGVVYVDNQEFVLADIPGLIAGASEGKGLGDRFLKHVERCGVLLHLIDSSAEDVVDNYRVIRTELMGYSPELAEKPEVLVLNKIDLLDEDERKEKIAVLKKYLKKNGDKKPEVLAISGVTGEGVEQVLRALYKRIEIYRKAQDDKVIEIKVIN
jgi:small GTP-binding protein